MFITALAMSRHRRKQARATRACRLTPDIPTTSREEVEMLGTRES
jgi:hypothetical protein